MLKKKISFLWVAILGGGFLLSALANIYLLKRPPVAATPQYKVIGVIDGDTFVIEGKHKIRLRHVQAPELEFCGGPEAKAELEKLIVDKYVRIENEIPDPWGRSMGVVFVGSQNINKTLIATGLVRYYHDVTPFEDEMKQAGTDAETQHLGIFAKCESTTPPDPKCVIKGNIRKDRDTKIYYLAGCRQYPFAKVSQDLGEQWFCSEKEAQAAGYTKAGTCK